MNNEWLGLNSKLFCNEMGTRHDGDQGPKWFPCHGWCGTMVSSFSVYPGVLTYASSQGGYHIFQPVLGNSSADIRNNRCSRFGRLQIDYLFLCLSWAMFGTRKGALKEKRLVMTTTHQFVFYLQCIPLQSMKWPFMNRHLHIVADYDDLLSFKQCQVQTHLYHRLINRTKLIFWVGACSLRNVLI